MITWKEDELGKTAVVDGWLALAVSKSQKGIIATINGATLPIGSRKAATYDSFEQAEEQVVISASYLAADAARMLKEYGQQVGFLDKGSVDPQ